MKKSKILLTSILLLFLFFGCSNNQNNLFEEVIVTRVIDGDTIEVSNEKEVFDVRLIGVDTPETKHPKKKIEFMGNEASNFTEISLLNEIIYLEKDVEDVDKYERKLRYVWLEKPKNTSKITKNEIRYNLFNSLLVENGYAEAKDYPPNSKYSESFLELQDFAKINELGLWNKKNKEKWDYDQSVLNGVNKDSISNVKEKYFVGSKNSDKFHLSSCRFAKKIDKNNEILSEDSDLLINNGYKPCKVCMPTKD